MIRPDNIKISLTFTQVNSTLYKAQLPLNDKLEGLYKLYVNVSDGSHIVPLNLNVTYAIPPKVLYKNIYPHNYRLYVDLRVREFSRLVDRLLVLNNRAYSLNVTGVDDGVYNLTGSLPIREGRNVLRIILRDKFNKTTIISKIIDYKPSVAEKFARETGFAFDVVESFCSKYLTLAKQLYSKNSLLLLPILKLYSENSTVFDEIYRNVFNDPRIEMDKDKLVSLTSKLFLDLGFTDRVKVFVPETGEYREEFLYRPTIQALGNYSIALYQLNLPHDREAAFLLGNATQINPKIFNFNPIVFEGVSGNVYIYPVIARDTWMLAKHLKMIKDSRFDVLRHPEMFEGINVKVIANDWSLFDMPYGIKYYNKNITPYSKEVWNLIMLQWELDSKPIFNKTMLYNRNMPWWNSTKLRILYPNENTRRQILFFLFYLPPATFDMEKQKVVAGIKGAKTSLLQAWKEHQKISKLYPNGKIHWPVKGVLPNDEADPRFVYYGWLVDRGSHGLNNTVKQFVGIDVNKLHSIIWKHPNDFWNHLKNYNGLDQYLTKNWKYWDLVKFIVGYERWNPNVTEIMGINYVTPDVLRIFGFPNWNIGIKPIPLGTPGAEWAICLPQYIVNDLMNKFPDVLLGPGNLFGLHCCKKGLIAERGTDIYHNPITDGIKYVYLVIDHSKGPIYLMKRD